MLNQFILVGRLKKIDKDELYIVVPRPKKEDGEDIIRIKLEAENIIKSTKEYCKKGDILGIKGKISTKNILVAEKISFLSSTHNK